MTSINAVLVLIPQRGRLPTEEERRNHLAKQMIHRQRYAVFSFGPHSSILGLTFWKGMLLQTILPLYHQRNKSNFKPTQNVFLCENLTDLTTCEIFFVRSLKCAITVWQGTFREVFQPAFLLSHYIRGLICLILLQRVKRQPRLAKPASKCNWMVIEPPEVC